MSYHSSHTRDGGVGSPASGCVSDQMEWYAPGTCGGGSTAAQAGRPVSGQPSVRSMERAPPPNRGLPSIGSDAGISAVLPSASITVGARSTLAVRFLFVIPRGTLGLPGHRTNIGTWMEFRYGMPLAATPQR